MLEDENGDPAHRAEPGELQIWCVGEAPFELPAIDGVAYASELGPATSAVLALPGASADTYRRLHRQHRLDVPILDFTRAGLVRADYAGEQPTAEVLRAALAAVEPIRERAHPLPAAVGGDRDGLTTLRMAYTRDCEIRAAWSFQSATLVDYPLLTGLPEPRETLDQLAGSGLLAQRFFDRVHCCGRCASSRLNVREECQHCRSSHIVDYSLIHHYHCAFQAAEERFTSGDRLICPKCRRELRHYGVDYDRPGTAFHCQACGEGSPEPAVGFLCMDCDGHTPGDRAETRDWYHYAITPEGVGAVESGVLPSTSLAAALEGHKAACSRRDFIKLARFYTEVALRYERPVMLAVLTVGNAEAIRSEFGASGLSRTFGLITEIVSQALRRSDAVTAAGHSLYLLLPETAGGGIDTLTQRIRERVRATVSVELELTLESVATEAIDTTLQRLAE